MARLGSVEGLLLNTVFQTSPLHELVVFDRLEKSERESLAELTEDRQFYGIVRSVDGGTLKAVDRDLALLLLTLQEPGQIPAFVVRDRRPEDLRRDLAALVLDGVLLVLVAGEMTFGQKALSHLGFRPNESTVPTTVTGLLSRDALVACEQLAFEDCELLSERLYTFGRLPRSPRWRKLLGDATAVSSFLGDPELAGWKCLPGRSDRTWLSWRPLDRPTDPKPARAAVFKLYVSPSPLDMPRIFRGLAKALRLGNAVHLKTAARADGMLRPDKLMIYFESKEGLFEAAALLASRFDGLDVHGVPFTADAGASGLLSWGLDPPESATAVRGRPRISWRSWLADRLAGALIGARCQHAAGSVVDLALQRLQLEGIDTTHWIPNASLWADEGSEGNV